MRQREREKDRERKRERKRERENERERERRRITFMRCHTPGSTPSGPVSVAPRPPMAGWRRCGIVRSAAAAAAAAAERPGACRPGDVRERKTRCSDWEGRRGSSVGRQGREQRRGSSGATMRISGTGIDGMSKVSVRWHSFSCGA